MISNCFNYLYLYKFFWSEGSLEEGLVNFLNESSFADLCLVHCIKENFSQLYSRVLNHTLMKLTKALHAAFEKREISLA